MKLLGIEVSKASSIKSLRENVADLERKLEDIGWVQIGQSGSVSQDLARESFEKMVKRSRIAYIKSPIVAQAIHIITNYTFGEGISTPRSSDAFVQETIDSFWKDRDNQISLTSPRLQIKICNKLQYDGELMFVLQPDVNGSLYVRIQDPLLITKIVRDKDDWMRPLFYRRTIEGENWFVPDWENGAAVMAQLEPNDAAAQDAWKAQLEALDIDEKKVVMNSFIYHVTTNNDVLDTRGVPFVYRALDWVNANSGVAGDMASFIRAQAQYAWKKKVKGTQNQVDAMKTRLKQNTNLTNPPYMAGSTMLENQLVDNMPIALPSSTGALFETGIRRSLLMVCASFGIMEHYFGDPSTGNLATATAMELPMLKAFKQNQKMWEGTILDILNFAITVKIASRAMGALEYNDVKNRVAVAKESDSERQIDIDFPPILEKDIKILAEGLSIAKSKGLIPIETAQRMFLQGAGINNIDEELKKEFEEPAPILPGGFGAEPGQLPAKESVAPTGFKTQRIQAIKLADKNRAVISKMGGYLKEIAGAYNKFYRKAATSAMVTQNGRGKFLVSGIDVHETAAVLSTAMMNAGRRYLPIAARMGVEYVESRMGQINESLREAMSNDFLTEQIELNEAYILSSLAPDVRKKLIQMMSEEFEDEAAARAAVREVAQSFEKRVGAYAGAFWTVEERAVKMAASTTDSQAKFVGVEDGDNCPGCAAAIEGNPWPAASIPVPGDQDCRGNCRHAIQLVGDKDLTESDIQFLKDEEKRFKDGVKLLEESAKKIFAS